jgi:hypothetical protein
LGATDGGCTQSDPPPCPTCVNSIDGNTSSGSDGTTIRALAGAPFTFSLTKFTSNSADHMFRANNKAEIVLSNCTVVDNKGKTAGASLKNLFDYPDGSGNVTASVVGCTIANNALSQNPMFSDSARLTINDSLIWQPSRQTIAQPSNTTVFSNVLVQDANSYAPGSFLTFVNVHSLSDPEFANAAAGDYHLLDASPAIDYSTTGIASGIDLDGKGRGKTLKKGASPFDVGAFELQTCRASDDIFCDSYE